jgi:hypothetical protein
MARELARLEVSQARRTLGVALQGGLGLFLLFVAVTQPFGGGPARGGLALLGLCVLWLAWRFWRAAGTALVLTADGLSDSTGRALCTYEDIEKVERGVFALRPSAGFAILCKTPVARGWAPGLWWAFGRRIGIGGATPRPAGKQMADIISVMLSERGAEIRAESAD